MTTEALQQIHEDLKFIKEKMITLERDVKEIKVEIEPEVRKDYLKKLENIEQKRGKIFTTKEAFLHHLEHEL